MSHNKKYVLVFWEEGVAAGTRWITLWFKEHVTRSDGFVLRAKVVPLASGSLALPT